MITKFRPEQVMKKHAYNMLDTIFNESSSDDEVDMCVSTLVEIISPELMKMAVAYLMLREMESPND